MCYQEGVYGHYFNSLCLFGYIAFLEMMTNGTHYIQFSQTGKQIQARLLLAFSLSSVTTCAVLVSTGTARFRSAAGRWRVDTGENRLEQGYHRSA